MSNEAEKLADALGSRVVRQWTHSTGESPRAMGFKHDAECQRAAALLRRQAEQIKELREALEPFASFADHYPTAKAYGNRSTSGEVWVISSHNKGDAVMTVEDFHRARAALSNTKDQ